MHKHTNKNLSSNELEDIFLKYVSTLGKKDVTINFDEVILSGKNAQINEGLSIEAVLDLFGEPEIFTPAHKSYPTMLVYGDLEFRFRNNDLKTITITFGENGVQVPTQINIGQFQPVDNRNFTAIEEWLKQKHVSWEKDKIMSDVDQEVYITKHNVHLAFYEGILAKIGIDYM